MEQYNVLTGIVKFAIQAENPAQAIGLLKARIDQRRHQGVNPEIGMSLVEALDEGRLNFLVLDAGHASALAGEWRGEYQNPPSPELILSFSHNVSVEIQRQARAQLAT